MCKEYTVYEAAEMTARCKAVDFYWNAPTGEQFVAHGAMKLVSI